jgi:hypothetical protein
MWVASGVSITRTTFYLIRDISTPNSWRPVTGHEDRHAVVVTVSVVDLLRGAPTRQHHSGGLDRVGDDRDIRTPWGVASARD